ncbi:MAG: hypothetical protein EXR72_08200 [Myxococcales bacterium]|nr:hypothetical protein [Myxococcales bacterium]
MDGQPPEQLPPIALPVGIEPPQLGDVVAAAPASPVPDLSVPGVPGVIPAVALPRPKPVIIPERDGDDGYRTPSLHLRRVAAGFYLTVTSEPGKSQVIHITPSQVDRLGGLLDAAPGRLWNKLCEIPLERPLPSRALEEELRVMLTRFAGELRQSPRRG